MHRQNWAAVAGYADDEEAAKEALETEPTPESQTWGEFEG
jgi:hypothetical protein